MIICKKLCLFLFGDNFAASHGNLLEYVATFFLANISKLSRACGANAKAGDSESPGCKIESATANVLFFKTF